MSWKEQKFLDYYDLPITTIVEKEVNVEFSMSAETGTVIADIEIPEEMLKFERFRFTVYHSPVANEGGSYSGTFQLYKLDGGVSLLANSVFTYTSASSSFQTYASESAIVFLTPPIISNLWGKTVQLRYNNSSSMTKDKKSIVRRVKLEAYTGYSTRYSVRQMDSSVRKVQRIKVNSIVNPTVISAVNPEKTIVIPPVRELTPIHIKGDVEGYHQVIEFY